MAKLDVRKTDILLNKHETDSYQGKILSRSLSNRILSSRKATGFLVYLEEILYNMYDSVRLIKKSINFRVGRNSKIIDN